MKQDRRNMMKLIMRYLFLFLIIIAINIYAQQDFTDTPVGKKLQHLLEAFESDDVKSFIETNFSYVIPYFIRDGKSCGIHFQ